MADRTAGTSSWWTATRASERYRSLPEPLSSENRHSTSAQDKRAIALCVSRRWCSGPGPGLGATERREPDPRPRGGLCRDQRLGLAGELESVRGRLRTTAVQCADLMAIPTRRRTHLRASEVHLEQAVRGRSG